MNAAPLNSKYNDALRNLSIACFCNSAAIIMLFIKLFFFN